MGASVSQSPPAGAGQEAMSPEGARVLLGRLTKGAEAPGQEPVKASPTSEETPPDAAPASPLHVARTRFGRKNSKNLDSLGRTANYDDLLLGVKMACLAYVDDQPGTIETLEGAKEAIEVIAGSAERARAPLTELLADQGFVVDRIFSHMGLLKDGDVNDTQGFVAHSETDVVLAYRGSVSLQDCVTDLTAGHVLYRPFEDVGRGSAPVVSTACCGAATPGEDLGRAHRGFYDAFLSTIPDIEEAVMPHLEGPTPKRLVLVGHSLGGAIATGALAYLLRKVQWDASSRRMLFVTLGQPRFGDRRFRDWVSAEMRRLQALDICTAARFVHDSDGVPMVPPEQLSYRHLNIDLCLLTRGGEMIVGPKLKSGFRGAKTLKQYLLDHNPREYLQLLHAVAEGELRGGYHNAKEA